MIFFPINKKSKLHKRCETSTTKKKIKSHLQWLVLTTYYGIIKNGVPAVISVQKGKRIFTSDHSSKRLWLKPSGGNAGSSVHRIIMYRRRTSNIMQR